MKQKIMGKNFYLATRKIHNDYQDDASNIWKGNPECNHSKKIFRI